MSDTTRTTAATVAAEVAELRELLAAQAAQIAELSARPVRKAAAPKPLRPCVCGFLATATGETTGCDAETKATFAPGHDAKTKGLLIRAAIAGVAVSDGTGEFPAEVVAARFGFAGQVADGKARAEAAAAEKAARAAAKAAEAAARA